MKPIQYKYNKGETGSPVSIKKMIRDAALTAARRTEGYKFRYGPGVVVDNKGTRVEYDDNQTYFGPKISHEMQLLANERLELYTRKDTSIWDDRNSRIAKPWGAEVYLTNDRGNNILGAPRYYQDDMNDDSQLPDARTRFPYSNEANEAAKKITLLFTDKLMLKHWAASILQKHYKAHKIREKWYWASDKLLMASRKIKFFLWKRFVRIRSYQKILKTRKLAAIKLQTLARKFIARLRLPRRRLWYKNKWAKRLGKWVRKCLRYKLEQRRKLRRMHTSAKVLQRICRGALCRMKKHKRKTAALWISYIFRRFWKRKYRPYAKKIYRAYRNMKLWKRAVLFQRIIRGFLGRRRRHKQALLIISAERVRVNDELRLVTRAIRKSSRDLYWCGLQDTERFTKQMEWLDGICSRILKGEITVNGKLTKNLNAGQRTSLAILFAFCNSPNLCIDWNGWSIAQEYFKPNKSNKSTATLHQTIWDTMNKVLMHDIVQLAMSEVIVPKRSIHWTISLQKYLPDKLIAKAVLVRRWKFQLNRAVARAIIKFRSKRPPRRCCPQCLEPMFSDFEMFKHNQQTHTQICFRNYQLNWIGRKPFWPMEAVLVYQCNALTAQPKLKRPKGKENLAPFPKRARKPKPQEAPQKVDKYGLQKTDKTSEKKSKKNKSKKVVEEKPKMKDKPFFISSKIINELDEENRDRTDYYDLSSSDDEAKDEEMKRQENDKQKKVVDAKGKIIPQAPLGPPPGYLAKVEHDKEEKDDEIVEDDNDVENKIEEPTKPVLSQKHDPTLYYHPDSDDEEYDNFLSKFDEPFSDDEDMRMDVEMVFYSKSKGDESNDEEEDGNAEVEDDNNDDDEN